jgi:hypothetical protein
VGKGEFFLHSLVGGESKGRERRLLCEREQQEGEGPSRELEVRWGLVTHVAQLLCTEDTYIGASRGQSAVEEHSCNMLVLYINFFLCSNLQN